MKSNFSLSPQGTATPTFLNYVFDRADCEQPPPGSAGQKQLESLRLIVVGAEKCPDALFERCRDKAPPSLGQKAGLPGLASYFRLIRGPG